MGWGEPHRPVAAETANEHPAQFTECIIDKLREIIPRLVPREYTIYDPYAGAGVRLGGLCDELGYTFMGGDLELWKGRDRRVARADATDPWSYPSAPHAVVTSPTYNNGVNDHFEPKDDSRRLTYRAAAGHALDANNTGRWSGRGSQKGERTYWQLSATAVSCWPNIAIVNVKDSVRSGEIYPLVEKWRQLLTLKGYVLSQFDVATPGWRYGDTGKLRVDHEMILVATR